MKPRLPQGIVTLVMTDVQGSTSRWERDPLDMRLSIELHDRIAYELFPKMGGHIVKERGEGDSLFVAFERPVDAIKASVEFLTKLEAAPWPSAPLTTRIAVHVGDVVARDRDYYGPSVNRCARIRSITHGGQILVSAAVERIVDRSLEVGIQLRPLGAFRLKDLLSPEKLFQVMSPKLRHDFPLPASLDKTPNNLPTQLTTYIGRAHDIDVGHQLLRTHRLITFTGPGGSGKTRLALQIAAEAMEDFPSGVIFIDLTPAAAADVPRLITRAICGVLQLGELDQEDVLANFNSKALLVLDNCEHVIDAAAQRAIQLLSGCPNVSILATSRELLQCPGEVCNRVEALSFPPVGETDRDLITQYEAVQLFVERASQRISGFAVDDANAKDIAAICRELDGIPLAIEHAASQILSMSTYDMLARLGSRMSLLRTRDRGILPRHATLQATLDWSYDILLEDERKLLPLLTVFQSGWDLPACISVARLEGLDESLAIEALNGLITKSMVSLDGSTSGSTEASGASPARRFRLLETTKEYAKQKLDNAGGRATRAAFMHFMTLAEGAYAAHGTINEQGWSNRIRLDMPNILALLSWGLENRETGVLQFLGALRHAWRRFGYVREGASLLEAALQAEPQAVEDLVARNWNILGTLYWSLDTLEKAENAYERSAKIYSALGDELSRAGLINNLALIQVARGDHERAIPLMYDAISIYRRSEDWAKVALVSINLALEEINAQRPQQALARLAEIKKAQVEDVNLLARVHKTAALAYLRERRMKEACAELGQALKLLRSSPDITIFPSLFVFLAAATSGVVDPSERAHYLGAGEASAKTGFAQFSDVEEEVRNQACLELEEILGSREFDKLRKYGGRLDTTILVERALLSLLP